ncbi:histone-lysine N-methyltransferase SETMAR [Trichonephila clavipes]|nr:histone-lysine N-methyltransferase SETMAR [Trichonephila clavipes]
MLIEVSDAIREKCKKEFRRKVVLFHQDNARPHVSAMTSWTLYTLEWGLMQHPPYRPDIAPSDYYLFFHLQLHLEGTIFNSKDKVIKEVNRFLDSFTPQFFAEGIEKLPKLW